MLPSTEFASLDRAQRAALRELLIAAVVAADHNTDSEALSKLAQNAPVELLVSAAAIHRLSGAASRGLAPVDALPPIVRAALAQESAAAAFRHMIVVGALHQISQAFDAEGLRWVVMKGPVLASLLYSHVGDRTSGDLDLLVGRRDFPAATRILEDFGYRHDIHDWSLAESMMAGAVPMTGPMVCVDLHWHLHYAHEDRIQFDLDPEEMLGRARRVRVSGADVATFDPTDTLLTLGFHAARSGGGRLVWFKDIERSVAVERVDFDELVRRCERSACGPSVGLMLDRSRRVIGAEIDEAVVDALTPRTLRQADRTMCAVVHPIQLHDRDTPTRWLVRSVRSSLAATALAIPKRGVRAVSRALFPPPANETDDSVEKASYLQAVSRDSLGER